MTCDEAQPLLHAYLDSELDLSSSFGIEQHIATCDACAGTYRKLQLMRAEIADADLDFGSDAAVKRIRLAIERRGELKRLPGSGNTWRTRAFVAAIAAVLVLAYFVPVHFSPRPNPIDEEIVDNHLRSLLGDHLVDVPSSDRHTVKPWFQGKIDFAPAVPDLTAEGFVLAGGRLDVIDTRKVPVLIYKRRAHIINLWISQEGSAPKEPELSEVNGYHLERWFKDGMTYRAVSDMDAAELRRFADLIRKQ